MSYYFEASLRLQYPDADDLLIECISLTYELDATFTFPDDHVEAAKVIYQFVQSKLPATSRVDDGEPSGPSEPA